MSPDEIRAYLAAHNLTSERVQVTTLPQELPWIEGIHYSVIPNNPPARNMPCRLRDNTGESFDTNPEPGSVQAPGSRLLTKTQFQDYAVSQLGGDAVGMGRFTEIMDAARDSASPAVRFAYARYDVAELFEKTNTETLTALMAADSATNHLTSDERAAILDNWPAN